MAEPFLENFAYYGGDISRLTQGRWLATQTGASLVYGLGGTEKWWLPVRAGAAAASSRFVLGASFEHVITSFRVYLDQLTSDTDDVTIFGLEAAGNRRFSLRVSSIGAIQAYGPSDVLLGSSAPALVVAGDTPSIEVRVLRDAAAGEVEVRLNGGAAPVLNLSGQALGATDYDAYQVTTLVGGAGGARAYLTDIWLRSIDGASGGGNEDFRGDVTVAALFVNGDTEENNWAFRARKNLGTGILDLRSATNDAVSCADAANLEIGASDFEITTWVRFNSLPTGSLKAQIAGKWQETGNQRSWQFYKAGPDIDSGGLIWRISTDGTAGTLDEIFNWPWFPDLDVWYGLSVQREANVTRLFIAEINTITGEWDFIEQGTGFADANTYFDSTAALAIGAEMSSATATIVDTGVDGFMDETRLTIGTARNTDSYSIDNEPLPRGALNDPDWAQVVLLAGYDSGINDESSFARTVTARSGAVQYVPDDGVFAYQSIEHPDPRDDTFIEAALVAATGFLTFAGNPGDSSETVTIGSDTYTFVDALESGGGPAYAVVIGADAGESIANLVAAINGESGAGIVYGTGTSPNTDVIAEALPSNQMLATAIVPGVAGNSIATTEASSTMSWAAVTLTDGADIPAASEYTLQRLPRDAAQVFSAHIIAREFKSSAGPASTRGGFVDVFGTADMGSTQSLTQSPIYRLKNVVNTDPTTSGALTPSTFVNSRIRIDRTA